MTKPVLSKDFTLEDIRKMRTYNAERCKNMTPEEIVAETKRNAERVIIMLDPSKMKRITLNGR